MVNFRGRGRVEEEIEVDVSPDSKTIFISAGIEPVSMAVESFFKSDEAPTVSSHEVSAKFEFDGDRVAGRNFKIKQYTSDDGLLSPDQEEENLDSVIDVFCVPEGTGTKITVSGEAAYEELRFGKGIDSVDEIGEALANYISVNREKAALGYGPQHPLDDISPQSLREGDIPTTHDGVVETFSEWIDEMLNRSRHIRKEMALINDWANNSVGIIEGTSGSVGYPHTMIGEMNVAMHTHPKLVSVPLPSESDVRLMAAQKTGSFHCIVRSLFNSYFAPTESDDDGESDVIEMGGVTYNTFDKTSLATYEIVSGDRVDDIDDYIDEFLIKAEEIVEKDRRLCVRQIETHRGGLSDDVYGLVIDRVLDISDKIIDNLGDQTEEALRDSYNKQNKVVVPKYHEFEVSQHEQKPTRRY